MPKPPLTVEQILAWADAHHQRTGRSAGGLIRNRGLGDFPFPKRATGALS
jgi:hypothetical protein